MFKKMDNPWLVRVLLTLLPLFGMIVGCALAPLLVETINPDNTGTSVDIYALHHPEYCKTGAQYGCVFGLVVAAVVLVQLARQGAAEAKAGDTDAHAH